MKTAWLVKVDYKVPAMRGFSSYESALKYHNEIVDKIEEQIEEPNYEKVVTTTYGGKEFITHCKQWNEDFGCYTTLGLVSIKEIEWEEEYCLH